MGEELKYNSKEALLLQSTLRMIRGNLRLSTYLLQETNASSIYIVALCTSSRAATILVCLIYGRAIDTRSRNGAL